MQASKYGFFLLLGVACAMPACFKTDAGDDDDDDNGGSAGESSGGSSSGSGGKGGSSSGGSTSSGGSGGSTSSGGSGGSTSGSGGSSAGSSGTSPGVCSEDAIDLPSNCPSGMVSQFDEPSCAQFWSCYFALVCSSAGLECDSCLTQLEVGLDESDCVDAASAEYLGESCIQASQSIAGCEL